jgi:metal-sulfur cluster biosynthetic enzyme
MDDLKPVMPQQGPSFGIRPDAEPAASEKNDDISPPHLQRAKRDFDQSNPYYHVLNMVVDPEVGVGIVDMGLIYHVEERDGIVSVTMTLTSMGCPAGPQLTTDVDSVLRMQEGVKDVEIEVVWDPAWNPEMMNPEIRQMLFGGF